MTQTNVSTTIIRPASTEGGKRSHFDTVLDKVKYVGRGNGTDGSAFTIEDGEVGLGLNALDWLGYEIAKVFVANRDYLPSHIQDASRRIRRVKLGERDKIDVLPFITSGDAFVDDLRQTAKMSLLASLEANERDTAVANAFKALDDDASHGKYETRDYKTLPKEEVLCPIDIALIRALVRGNTSYEVSFTQDGQPDLVVRYEVSQALTAIFDGVKKTHKYAFTDSTCKRWMAFEYFVLNITNKDIAERLAISKQRASDMNRETCRWLLDEVKNLSADMLGYIANCPKTVEALRWVQRSAA